MASLLERIRRLDGRARDDLRGSVLESVRRLCSTRLGSAPACPAYGLPDAIHYSATTPDLVPSIPAALREAILTYEPRLSALHIEPMASDDWALQFQITGRLATGARSSAPIAFRTKLGAGSVRIEG
jgi:type VI secretion system lysozyme-like protein